MTSKVTTFSLLGALALSCAAAQHAAPTLPAPREFALEPPAPSDDVAAARDTVRAVEQRYRTLTPERGLRAASVLEQAVARLAQHCRLLPHGAGASALRFELRCSNQMFRPGVTQLQPDAATSWREAASLLRGLLSGSDSFQTMRIHLVGRVDRIGLTPTTYHRAASLPAPTCLAGRAACAAPAEIAVAALDDEAAQQSANLALSWERAANLGQQLLCGFGGTPASAPCTAAPSALPAGLELTAVGAGTTLFDQLARASVPPRPVAGFGLSNSPFDLAQARVVDVVIDLVPRRASEARPCADEGRMANAEQARLYCLEDATTHSGVSAQQSAEVASARCPEAQSAFLVSRVGATGESVCLPLLEAQLLRR